ncbi:hypothetical protein HYT51_02640 [Candidatus Woesearchaeota archaeon]|nr:hypothetical protein [Candidatus Woesearchaeota archaeon]
MLKRGLIITSIILIIAFLTYLNPSITSLGFFSFDKEDEIGYASDILNTNILNAQITSQNEIKALIQNKENINLKFFIQVTGDKGTDSYYDNSLLEAKSTEYLTISFTQEKTGNFIKRISIIPYLQLDNKKIVYKFSETSYQINKQIPTEETIQETSLDSEILTVPQQRESTYIYGNGLIASLDDQGNIQYYHKDNLGSVRAITDSNGNIIYSSSYEPFGNKFAETSYSPYTYTGKQLDDSGLYYYGARYYDSNLGRFTQLDPIADFSGSPYTYVSNNPLKYTDPNGKEKFEKQNIHYYGMHSPQFTGGLKENAIGWGVSNVHFSPWLMKKAGVMGEFNMEKIASGINRGDSVIESIITSAIQPIYTTYDIEFQRGIGKFGVELEHLSSHYESEISPHESTRFREYPSEHGGGLADALFMTYNPSKNTELSFGLASTSALGALNNFLGLNRAAPVVSDAIATGYSSRLIQDTRIGRFSVMGIRGNNDAFLSAGFQTNPVYGFNLFGIYNAASKNNPYYGSTRTNYGVGIMMAIPTF